MIYKAFSVRDEAVQAFLQPFFVRQMGEAIRSFSDAVSDANHQFSRHKKDYVLYEVGEFDDVAGRFSTIEPRRVISAFECGDAPSDPPPTH